MILITLNGSYTGSLKLVVIRWIRIGLWSKTPNKDQTYPYSVVAKQTCVICNCTNKSSQPIRVRVTQVCCGAQVQIWHSAAWAIRLVEHRFKSNVGFEPCYCATWHLWWWVWLLVPCNHRQSGSRILEHDVAVMYLYRLIISFITCTHLETKIFKRFNRTIKKHLWVRHSTKTTRNSSSRLKKNILYIILGKNLIRYSVTHYYYYD